MPPTNHYPNMRYSKPEFEPERCRRTDGKKWRCSRNAHPDSKYCERHIHRLRSCSRKHVESQSLFKPGLPSSSTARSIESRSTPGRFQSIFLGGASVLDSCFGATTVSELQMGLGFYGLQNGGYRSPSGVNSIVNEHNFFLEASGSARSLGMEFPLENSWSLMPSSVSSIMLSKARNSSDLESTYPHLHYLQDPKQHSFFG